MVYATLFPPLFIFWPVSIPCRAGLVLGSWKYVIINFTAIIQKIIYTLLSSFMDRSLTWIGSNRNIPPLLLLFNIFKYRCFNNFYDESKPPLNTVHRMVAKVLTFHENTEILPSVECYDLYPGNNDPIENITLVLVVIPAQNQPAWVEAAKKDWAWGTNASSFFCGASKTFYIANFFQA